MRNTTIADLIKGIRDMDRTLGKDPRAGLSKLRKAELTDLHSEVLDHFLKVTQPEVDAMLEEKFYHCEPCGGTNVLKACKNEHDRQNHPSQEQAANVIQPYRRQGSASDRIVERPATGPQITVVAMLGRKLVMGVVIGTVTRPATRNRNLVTVQHLGDDGQLLPRVTLHAASEVAA